MSAFTVQATLKWNPFDQSKKDSTSLETNTALGLSMQLLLLKQFTNAAFKIIGVNIGINYYLSQGCGFGLQINRTEKIISSEICLDFLTGAYCLLVVESTPRTTEHHILPPSVKVWCLHICRKTQYPPVDPQKPKKLWVSFRTTVNKELEKMHMPKHFHHPTQLARTWRPWSSRFKFLRYSFWKLRGFRLFVALKALGWRGHAIWFCKISVVCLSPPLDSKVLPCPSSYQNAASITICSNSSGFVARKLLQQNHFGCRPWTPESWIRGMPFP